MTLYEIRERIEQALAEAEEREKETIEGSYYTLIDRLQDLDADIQESQVEESKAR